LGRTDKLVHFVRQQLLGLSRKNAGEGTDLPLDLGGVEHQAVYRDQSSQSGEKCEQYCIGDAAGDQEEIGVGNLIPSAPRYVHPSFRGDFSGISSLPATIIFAGLYATVFALGIWEIALELLQVCGQTHQRIS
jgi:hypothetical protein